MSQSSSCPNYMMEARAGAMSLNNLAVSLFSRGCLREGCFLLHEARNLVKHCCLGDEKTAPSIEVFSRIQSARQHCLSALASPQQGLYVSNRVKILHSTGQPIHMPASPIMPSSNDFTFVQMETPLQASSAPQDLEALTAVILFNLGVAQLYADNLQSQREVKIQLDRSLRAKNKALNLFKAAHMVLTRSKSADLNCGIPNLVACVNAMAVQKIVVLLRQLGFDQDSMFAQERLGDMLQHFSQMGEMLRLRDNAAAAA